MVRLTDRPDMTLDVYRGRKTTTQQQQQGVAETQTELQCDTVKICMSFRGIKLCINVLGQNSVSLIHMFSACLNCVASFKSLHQILYEEMRRQNSTTMPYRPNYMYVIQGDIILQY